MSKPITYIYKNTGRKQFIKGVGMVIRNETIAIPDKPLKHPDLELVETVKGKK